MRRHLKRFCLQSSNAIRNLLLVVVLLFLSLSGCGLKKPGEGKETATTTLLPVQGFMNRLAGDAVEVGVMVPQGANPATYSPTPGQIRQMSGAQLYVKVGYVGFEQAWMDRLVELNPQMKVVDLSDGSALIRGEESVHGDHVHEGGVDPHIWMSPREVLRFLPALKAAMVSSWPSLSDSINARYVELVSEVQQRDETLQNLCRELTSRKFMIFHPALTYLARDYGLEQLSMEYEGKEPSPQALKNLIDEARAENIKLLFIQEEFDKRNAQLVSEETGAHLEVINPLSYDWFGNMDHITALFEQYLR